MYFHVSHLQKFSLKMAMFSDSTVAWGLVIVIVSTTETLTQTTHEPMMNATYDIEVTGTSMDIVEYSDMVDEVGDPSRKGWEWYPLVWTWWVILQAVSSLLGIVGNGIVIVVVYQRIASSRSTDGLIGALAVTDFLTSVFLFPIPWAKSVPGNILGHLYCKLLYPSFFMWFCITASTYVLSALCVERYLAVVYPLYFNRVITKRKVNLAIFSMWICAFVQVCYPLFTFVYDQTIGYCVDTIGMGPQSNHLSLQHDHHFRLFLPVMTMLITQILIARSLHRQAQQFKEMTGKLRDHSTPSFHVVARNRVIKMMLIVVIVYVISWSPNQIVYMCFHLGYISASYRGSPLHRTLTVIGFANSFANPFIYAASNRSFRQAIKNLFSCKAASSAPIFEVKEKTSKISTVLDP